jgi:outer membrane beta-barrel protein
MTWNATAALRWAPIYGKLSVVGELPVHFKAFVLAGAGAGGMKRDSVVSFTDSAFTPLHESATKPLFVGGVGMHFFLTQWAGLRIEVRDVAFPDSYRERIILQPSEGAASEGKPAGSPGLTNLVFVQVGAVFSI